MRAVFKSELYDPFFFADNTVTGVSRPDLLAVCSDLRRSAGLCLRVK